MKRLTVNINREAGAFPRHALDSPERIFDLVQDLTAKDREVFEVLHLDTRLRLVARETIAIGTLDRALIGPREVFSGAMVNGSAALALVHCHPSGDPCPSVQDRALTLRLLAGAEILGLKIIEHLIVGSEGFYSFSRDGGLEELKSLKDSGYPCAAEGRRRRARKTSRPTVTLMCPETGESMRVKLDGRSPESRLGTVVIDDVHYHLELVSRERIRSRENPGGDLVIDSDPDYLPSGSEDQSIALLIPYSN